MNAVVLTYDKYKIFTDHMIGSYSRYWPNNPFTFVIPYQNEEVRTYFVNKYENKVKLVQTPQDIVGTMNTLLNMFEDEEWIYWCMDDRYLIWIDISEMEKTYNWICNLQNSDIAAVKCTSHLMGQSPENIHYFRNKVKNEYNQIFYQRKNYSMIWIHQFLKCKVLKDVFLHIPRDLKMAKHMDFIVNSLVLTDQYKLYSNQKSLMILGESTSLGKITKNCYQSLLDNGYDIPSDFQTTDDYIISGEKKFFSEKVFFYSKRILRFLLESIGFRWYFKKRDIKFNRIKDEIS